LCAVLVWRKSELLRINVVSVWGFDGNGSFLSMGRISLSM
jgi:hypothetical protein